MEVNIVRPFVGRALQAFYKHDSPDLIPDQDRVSDRRPQVANNATRVCSFLSWIFISCFFVPDFTSWLMQLAYLIVEKWFVSLSQ